MLIRMGRYIVWHWAGRLPLVISYWLNAVLLQTVAIFALEKTYIAAMGRAPFLKYPLTAVLVVGLVSITLWAVVGAWRSAIVYSESSEKFWGTLAQFAIVLGVVRTLFSLIS